MTEKKSLSPVLPCKVKIALSFMVIATDFARRSNTTVNRRFLGFFDTFTKISPKTVKRLLVTDITIDSTRDLWFRLFVPTEFPNESKLPLVVFFHGGGFCFYSPDIKEYDSLCRRFALKTPAIVISVNYRLSHEHHLPAPYDDGFDTLKFIDQNKFDWLPTNADLSRCFLAGDSAGGNIAHHVARRYAESEAEFSNLKVIGLIGLQPFFGGEERTESEIRLKRVPVLSLERTDWFWKASLPQGADRDHEASNVFGKNSTDISGLKKFPPTLVFVGGFDPLQDWQNGYYQGLKRGGKSAKLIVYPNAFHGFYAFSELPETSLLHTEMSNFIQSNGETKE